MAFDLFGVLPDPDKAYNEAPQLPLDMNLLSSLREDLVGLNSGEKQAMRDGFQNQMETGREQAQIQIEQSAPNASVAIASNDRLNQQLAQSTFEMESRINDTDIALEREAKDRYRNEYVRLNEIEGQNKIARETAKANADLARKQGLVNFGSKILGTAVDLAINPIGIAEKFTGEKGGVAGEKLDVSSMFKATNVEDMFDPIGKLSTHSFLHEIEDGDTIESVAERYNMSVDAVAKLNGFDNYNTFEIGKQIVIQ